MANELSAYLETGLTLYVVLVDSTGQVWNGAAFAAINGANWTDYDIALTEATGGIYLGDMPAAAAGAYSYAVYEQAGVAAAVTDEVKGSGWIEWDGSAELPLSTVSTNVTTIDGKIDTIDNFLDTEVAAILADTNELQGDWTDGGRLDLILDGILEDTGTTLPGTLTTIEGKIDTVDDLLDTEVAAILADTDEMQKDLVDGGRLDLLIDGIKAQTDLLPSDPADQSELVAAITAATSTLATSAALATVSGKIDTVDDFLDTEVAAILADTNELQTDLTDGGRLDLLVDGIKAKTDNLPSDPADQSAVEAAITAATSVLATSASLATVESKIDTIDNFIDTEVAEILADTNELQVDWVDGGRLDLILDGILEDTGTSLPATLTTIDDFLDTEVAAILADTNELQTDLTDGGRLDLLVDGVVTASAAIQAKTDNLPSDPADESELEAAITSATSGLATAAALTTVSGKIDTIDDFLDTEVAAILADTNELQGDWVDGGRLDLLVDGIKTKTDNLPSDPADESELEAAITSATSGLATAAALATIDDFLDTEIAAILADTNELQTDLVNGGRLDLLIDAIKSKTDNLPASPAAVGSAMAVDSTGVASILAGVIEGTVTLKQSLMITNALLAGKVSGGGTTTITFRNLADDTNRVVMTVDTDGNRSAVVVTLT